MNWTDVVQAVAAALGAVATPVSVAIAARSFRHQRREVEAVRSERRLALLRLVHVRTESLSPAERDEASAGRLRIATVTNGASEPIYDLTLCWRGPDPRTQFEAINRASLLPGEAWEVCAPERMCGTKSGSTAVQAVLYFFDAEGRGWCQGPRGDLVPMRVAVDEGR